MAIDYGVTSTGFVVKTLEECVAELEDLFRTTFGNGISLDASTPEGQLIGIVAERESEIWDMAQEVYNSRDPDQATGAALSALCAITGTVGPQPATKSQLSAATLGGTTGTVVEAGSQASVEGTGVKFNTLEDATLSAVDAWAASHAYEVGNRCVSGDYIYECIIAGTSDAGTPVSGTGTDITDGTVHWRYLGEGDGIADVPCEAAETGPLAAPARTLTVIETPVSGWAFVTNAEDAAPGTDIETDAELRVRRVVELASAGASAPDAIRAAILKLTGVTACTVFENTTMVTDGLGRPPKSIEVLVTGGEDQDIWDAIWAAKPGGIEAHGTEVGTALDDQGVSHTVKFSRPVDVPIYAIVNLKKVPADYPADGDDQVKAALVAYGTANLASGVDVVSFQLKRAIDISGVMDVTELYIGTSPAPSSEAKIGITALQQASLDTSRITVNATDYEDVP
jgi:uncharacterized phage protein gp47/JayE